MLYELNKRDLEVVGQVPVPIIYDGVRMGTELKLDLLVSNKLVVELKAVDSLLPIHTAQVLTYLKLSQHRLALLINFNVVRIKDGIRRLAL